MSHPTAGPRSRRGPLRIGELAKRAGLSPDTLRHYERVGVLPAPHRSRAGYREYGPRALDRIRLVQRALRCGFTLAELARVLELRDGGAAPCRRVHALATRKLTRLERDIALLERRRDALRRTLHAWRLRIAATPRGRQARLLDHIPPMPRRGRARVRGARGTPP